MPIPPAAQINNQVEQQVAAQVTVGSVTPDDYLGAFRIGTRNTVWADYMVTNRYERDSHRYLLGITKAGGYQGRKASVVQLAEPTLLWISEWTAARLGAVPAVPSRVPKDTNWVLMDEQVSPAIIAVAPDGVTPYYRISGVYVFAHLNPSVSIYRNLVFPLAPWLEDQFQRFVSADGEKTGIIDLF